jgi:hypothetical protein
MSDCTDCILRFLKERLWNTRYASPFLKLRISENRITRDLVICCLLKPRYMTRHLLRFIDKIQDNFWNTHSWPSLCALALSLHEPKPCDFSRQVPAKFQLEPEVKLCVFRQTTDVGLPFFLAWINPYLLKT